MSRFGQNRPNIYEEKASHTSLNKKKEKKDEDT